MAQFKTRDDHSVHDGDSGTFTLQHGVYEDVHERQGMGIAGEPVERVVAGKARSFEHVERVYDEEHIAIGKTSETRWEIVTDDPRYPAVGFLPEHVLTFTKG